MPAWPRCTLMFADYLKQGNISHEDFTERSSESWFDPAGRCCRTDRSRARRTAPCWLYWTREYWDEEPPYGEVYSSRSN